MGAPETVRALVRLKARHPNLKKVISDNYPTFEYLKKTNDQRWELIPPRAPYQGGLWERAIKTVKRMLAPYLHGVHSVAIWRTLFAVAESVTNMKPLVQLIMDPEQTVITPQDIMEAYELAKIDWGRKRVWEARWKHLAKIWQKEMLQYVLRERRRNKGGRTMRINDAVLLEDRMKDRCDWKKGKIKEILPSHDFGKRNCVDLPLAHTRAQREPATI